jgi:hypothetical protein
MDSIFAMNVESLISIHGEKYTHEIEVLYNILFNQIKRNILFFLVIVTNYRKLFIRRLYS